MINTKAELDSAIQKCLYDGAGIEIYVGLKSDNIRRANISSDLQSEILEMFSNELAEKILNSEYRILPVSTTEEAKDAIYRYDLDTKDAFKIFDEVLDPDGDISLFSFKDDGIANIAYLLLVISTVKNAIVLYRPIPSVSLYNHKKGLFIRKSDDLFGKVEEDFIRISTGIEFFKINDDIFCFNLQKLQQSFHIDSILVDSANHQIEKLDNRNLVKNIDKLKEYCSDTTIARKLSKIVDNSPILNSDKISNESIVSFINDNSAFLKHIKTNQGQIEITSKEAAKQFIKLLNDNYLKSELSTLKYDSSSKSIIE